MFYIGTKRGFVESITASGLLNETLNIRSACAYPTWQAASKAAGKSTLLQQEYYAILGTSQPCSKLGRFAVRITYNDRSTAFAYINEGDQIVECKDVADRECKRLASEYPMHKYDVVDI